MDQSGAFRPGWLAWDAGLALWLLTASRIYQAQYPLPWTWLAGSATVMALAIWACGLHRDARANPTGILFRLLACLVLVALLRLGLGWISPGSLSLLEALWFGAVLALLATASHRVIARLAASAPAPRPGGEGLRWLVLAALVVWVYAPLYTEQPSGVGDARWYKIMLADFVTQVRATGLPVWAGQTEYAFNGAVIPLRMAPWFQHAGALLDWLTGRSLDYVALSNLELAVNALAGAFAAYFCFRAIVPRQPWSALAVAFVYAASPAVLSPLCVGDQYMTFLTMPFLPVAGYALWRICSRDDVCDYLLLAAALAALWHCHPPIGLCLGFFAAVTGVARLLLRRGFPWRNAVVAGAAFLCLGSLPFVSVFSLGLTASDQPLNNGAIEFNLMNYPGIFKPLTAGLLSDQPGQVVVAYQPGWAALLLCTLALVVFVWRRTLSAAILLFLVGLLFLLVLPIPVINAFLWHQVPNAAMHVLNTWPIQRLAGIWVILMLTLGIGGLALLESARRSWLPAACFWGLLLPASAWTGWQSRFISQRLEVPLDRAGTWRSAYEKHNLVLTRYAFNPFSTVPAYFSHGYIDPVLEHRLLRPDLTLLVSNAESAVRHGPRPAPDPEGTALLARGTWRAVNDNFSAYYNMSPRLALPAQQHLALWLDPLEPGQPGVLQIRGKDVFREYILPDSGVGSVNRPTLRGFGTLPSSSKVISLFTRDPQEIPLVINIAAEHTPAQTDFDFARYELWRYDPKDLPVVINSWAPYHLTVRSPEPGYLETPRAWLPHYRGRINGRYVRGLRSPDGLVMFPVPAGVSDITVKYIPPLWLEFSYWLTAGSWVVLLFAGTAWQLLPRPVPASA